MTKTKVIIKDHWHNFTEILRINRPSPIEKINIRILTSAAYSCNVAQPFRFSDVYFLRVVAMVSSLVAAVASSDNEHWLSLLIP